MGCAPGESGVTAAGGLSARLALRVYGFLCWALVPVLRWRLRRRARAEPIYGQRVDERFGYYAADVLQSLGQGLGPCIWVHAVSLGETRAAGLLLTALREATPGVRIVLTHGTATGRAAGAALLQPGDVQLWQPWDTPGAVRRFLDACAPQIGLLIETEVWPNMVAACAQAGVPLYLVNARLSEASLRGYQRAPWLSGPAFAALAGVWAQSDADADRLRALGAPVRGVPGNFKFDARPDAQQVEQGRALRSALRKPVVMLASSREGEESHWLQAFKAMRADVPDCHWLLVPRHPQRFDAVAHVLRGAGLSFARRSQHSVVADWVAVPAEVWLGDSVGEMALYYSLADVVLLGGSFAPLGGQNLIEAAACGCTVVMGPHTFNFSEVAERAVEAGAAVRVADMAQALEAVTTLLESDALQRHAQAQDFAAAYGGAVARTVGALMALQPRLT
jgi:3-deoxy-D-manno-octulosonic-acid transferase